MSRAAVGGEEEERCRYKGVRRRRWGKWVSEIRVPGTRERLWLGSYASPQAAAIARDTAVYFLRGSAGAAAGGEDGSGGGAALNFPERAAAAYGAVACLSPRSVQRVASDAGMAADAQLVAARESAPATRQQCADRTGAGIAQGVGANEYDAYTYMGGSSSPSSSSREQLASGEISVDDMEILM